jgi:hypothetical protein
MVGCRIRQGSLDYDKKLEHGKENKYQGKTLTQDRNRQHKGINKPDK